MKCIFHDFSHFISNNRSSCQTWNVDFWRQFCRRCSHQKKLYHQLKILTLSSDLVVTYVTSFVFVTPQTTKQHPPSPRLLSLPSRLLQLTLYCSLPASQLHRLQLIQNAPARAVSRIPLHSPISSVLHSLHWLKIEQCMQYRIISITHNLLHNATPSYLYLLFNIQPTRPICFSNCICLAHPKLTFRLKFSDRSFRNAAPSLWNKLPAILLSLSTEETHANPVSFSPVVLAHQQFLKHLKTHLFTLSFPPQAPSIPSAVYLFDQSWPIPCNFIEYPRIYQHQLVLFGTIIWFYLYIYLSMSFPLGQSDLHYHTFADPWA